MAEVESIKTISFPKIIDNRGTLSFIEGGNHVPFQIKRIFYLYNIKKGMTRGGHAHKNLHQLLLPISGSFDVELDNGIAKKLISLSLNNNQITIPLNHL